MEILGLNLTQKVLGLQVPILMARMSVSILFMHECQLPLLYVPDNSIISNYAMYLGLPVATHGRCRH